MGKSRSVLLWLGWLLLMFLCGALLGNIVSIALTQELHLPLEVVLLVSYPVMFLPLVLSERKRRSGLFKGMHRPFRPEGKKGLYVFLAVVATLSLGFMTDALTSILPPVPEHLKALFETMTSSNLVVNLICVSVFAPLFEEWLCRGTIMKGLMERGVKPVWAIVISAFIFAMIHGNPWQAVPAFLIGALMGYVYYKTGSLLMSMLMHCTNNTFAIIVAQSDSLKDMESWMDVMPAGIYWAGFALSALILGLSLLAFSKVKPSEE